MKTRLLAIVLGVIMVGLGACGGKDPKPDVPKSSAKEITSVTVGGQLYTKSGDTFTFDYPKSGAEQWASVPTWPAPVQIIHTGVSISPSANTITLNPETGTGVTYTVTAEDGSTKVFTIKATRRPTL